MIRIGGVLALLASLGLAGILMLQVREERYAGPIHAANSDEVVFDLDESPEPLIVGLMGFRPLPETLPRVLDAHLGGTKSREWIGMWLHFPDPLPEEELRGRPAELRHRFLVLPFGGTVASRTTVRVGSAEWSDSPWRLRGILAGLTALPLAAWALASLPVLLLRKRTA